MKRPGYLMAVATGLLAASLAAFFATADRGRRPASTTPTSVSPRTPLVDDGILQSARQLFTLADTAEEQEIGREALRLADHEVDQAFATALRQTQAAPPPSGGPLQQITARIAKLKARMQAYDTRIAQLTKQAADDATASDELAVLKGQRDLDEDELQDAQEDLNRQGGDRHAVLERALQQHEAIQQQPPPQAKAAAANNDATLLRQAQLWLDLNGRDQQILAARSQAEAKATALLKEHESLEAQPVQTAAAPSAPNPNVTQAAIARLHQLADRQKTLSEYDKRVQDSRQLAYVYGRWSALVEDRRRRALHSVLGSVAGVLAILLAVIWIDRAISRAFRQADRRRLHQLRSMSALAVQVIGLLLALLVVFGPPTQVTTIIGLATAGLTVALKDFIVAFVGWFVLLGRNGIHVGDWVEIEGVGGEVIEIGLLKTVLLEVGNWTATGHPTGRRVGFLNSFAIEGHFFNFSTVGQWLWDQIQVTLPVKGDPYQMADQIASLAARETEAEVKEAEEDWKRVTSQYGMKEFSAKPAVELRPSAAGMDIVVRYITRAPQRYEMKSRLYQMIVNLMREPAGAAKA
jgi:small-conductance mechanosensitive channel